VPVLVLVLVVVLVLLLVSEPFSAGSIDLRVAS
jgi:hypothetical protein